MNELDLAQHGVKMTPHFVASGLCNIFEVPAGKCIGQHRHILGHTSFLLLGAAVLVRDGTRTHLIAPSEVYLEAGTEHCIEAVTDILWACNWPDAQQIEDVEDFRKAVTL